MKEIRTAAGWIFTSQTCSFRQWILCWGEHILGTKFQGTCSVYLHIVMYLVI